MALYIHCGLPLYCGIFHTRSYHHFSSCFISFDCDLHYSVVIYWVIFELFVALFLMLRVHSFIKWKHDYEQETDKICKELIMVCFKIPTQKP